MDTSYSKCPIVRLPYPRAEWLWYREPAMSHLTIVADDSPLQRKSRRARLSEDGWGICGESVEGEIVPGETNQEREPAVFNFPAPIPHTDGAKPSRTYSGKPRLILITVHQESRLLQYESHYRPSVAREPELAPVVRAAIHQVVPYAIQDQAEVLCIATQRY